MRLAALIFAVTGLSCASAASPAQGSGTSTPAQGPAIVAAPAQGPGALAAPNESIVTAQVTKAMIVDSTAIGIAPPQQLCALTLTVLSTKTARDLLPAIRATDKIVSVYSKDLTFTRLEGTTITVAITLRGDQRSGRLWLLRIEQP